jgi:hypothetical protein
MVIYFFGLGANYMLTQLCVPDWFLMCTVISEYIFLTCSVSNRVSFLHGSMEFIRSNHIVCGLFTTMMGLCRYLTVLTYSTATSAKQVDVRVEVFRNATPCPCVSVSDRLKVPSSSMVLMHMNKARRLISHHLSSSCMCEQWDLIQIFAYFLF